MKPSFAEAIQKEWIKNKLQPCPVIDTSETIEARKAIIERLDSHDGQLLYLMMFIGIMQNRFPDITNLKERVLLYSAAYNSSFFHSEETMRKIAAQSTFHTGAIQFPSDKNYCYSDIALYYFLNYSGNLN
ncbi:MAG: hypothetical protein JXR53_14410 [Bacteroidales bacterium]|nr:hypothetical protein [Bacteroidales bacterium]